MTRILGRSVDEVFISFGFSLVLAAFIFLFNSLFPSYLFGILFLCFVCSVVMLVLDGFYFIRVFWWVKFRKPVGVLGYLRLDNTIEIHIGSTNQLKFISKLRRTIRYAQKHGHMLEYTSGMVPYGRLINQWGDAVVSVKVPGLLGRIYVGWGTRMFTGDAITYYVDHPLKVVLDPINLGKRKRKVGNMERGEALV